MHLSETDFFLVSGRALELFEKYTKKRYEKTSNKESALVYD